MSQPLPNEPVPALASVDHNPSPEAYSAEPPSNILNQFDSGELEPQRWVEIPQECLPPEAVLDHFGCILARVKKCVLIGILDALPEEILIAWPTSHTTQPFAVIPVDDDIICKIV
jgi:hypothetical protein